MPKSYPRTSDAPQRDAKRTPKAKRTTLDRKRVRAMKYDATTRKAGR